MSYQSASHRPFREFLISAAMVASIPYERWFPFRSRAAIEARRDRRIREVVRLAYETVPFYRKWFDDAGVRPEHIRGARDLALLPPLPDSLLRADPLAFVSRLVRPEECHRMSSSGRSGRLKYYYHDRRSVMMNVAYSERHEAVFSRFTHRRVGRRLLVMNVEASISLHVHRHYRNRLRLLAPLGPRRERVDIGQPFEELVDVFNRHRPEMVISYGMFMGSFFEAVHRRGIELHRPELISLGGEGILPERRRLIEETFGIPIVMTYQSGESLKIGYECEERAWYHLHEDLCHVRLLDAEGREVPEGEVGRIHITNLVNRGTILINYDQGDSGRMLPDEPCPCGRRLRRMELVDGRRWPMVRTLDGRALHFVQVVPPLREHGNENRVQFVVERPDRWRVLVAVPEAELTPEWRERAAREIEAIAGAGISVSVESCEMLERTDAGKWVPVIVRCKGEPPYDDL